MSDKKKPIVATSPQMALKRYTAFWGFAGGSFGHRSTSMLANSYEQAEKQLFEKLDVIAGRGRIEYYLVEEPPETKWRIYNNERGERE